MALGGLPEVKGHCFLTQATQWQIKTRCKQDDLD